MLALWWMYDRVARSCLHHVGVKMYFVNFYEVLLEVFEDIVVSLVHMGVQMALRNGVCFNIVCGL
jgi:hypothetical protein